MLTVLRKDEYRKLKNVLTQALELTQHGFRELAPMGDTRARFPKILLISWTICIKNYKSKPSILHVFHAYCII